MNPLSIHLLFTGCQIKKLDKVFENSKCVPPWIYRKIKKHKLYVTLSTLFFFDTLSSDVIIYVYKHKYGHE